MVFKLSFLYLISLYVLEDLFLFNNEGILSIFFLLNSVEKKLNLLFFLSYLFLLFLSLLKLHILLFNNFIPLNSRYSFLSSIDLFNFSIELFILIKISLFPVTESFISFFLFILY